MKTTPLLIPALLAALAIFVHPAFAAENGPPKDAIPLTAPLELKSPDGKIALHFDLKQIGGKNGCPVYDVSYEGRPVLVESRLGLQLRNGGETDKFCLLGQHISTSDTTWKPVYGERDTIRDHYNQLVVNLQMGGREEGARKLEITFRAYNEGVAFAYTVPTDDTTEDTVDIVGEITQFAFPTDATTWVVYAAQGDYTEGMMPLSKVAPGAQCPFTVRVEEHLYAAINSARAADYSRMLLRRNAASRTTMEAYLDGWNGNASGEVLGKAPFTTPWRVVMIAESPGKLLEQNYLELNLNDPCALSDTSWIQPGNVIRETGFTTASGKASVDFAVKHNLRYIEYDAGWYGSEYKSSSDARDVAPRLKPKLNLQEVIDYGRSRKIGVILYVNQRAMESQLDEILPIYEKWGIKGVKYGFVNVGSQYWMAKNHEAVRKAAQYHLMVDMHDEFRNCGYERTYPNFMEVEGIGGDETNPTPEHNATLPFTRYLTGPADHTYCWNHKEFRNLKGHQLAISTIFYSPWAFLYWYDSAANVPDEPGLEYWDHLPATWDETRVLQGDIGRRVVVARRKGAEWFVGAIAPVDGKFSIALDFLPAGRKYTAKVYFDKPGEPDIYGKPPGPEPAAGAPKPVIPVKPGVAVRQESVDTKSVVNADIPHRGGMAIWLFPAE